jgi:hypothetical protein
MTVHFSGGCGLSGQPDFEKSNTKPFLACYARILLG